MAVDRDDGGDRRGRRDLSFADGTARRCPQLIQEARRAPPSPSLVTRRPRQIQAPARASHGDVQQPPLLGDHVLATADQRFEHRGRKLEAREAGRLRKPALDERGHKDRVELEPLGLMDGHDLQAVGDVRLRWLLVLTREQDKVEVAHERVERVVRRRLAEVGDILREPAHVGGGGISRLLHQLEEEVADVEAPGDLRQPLEQRPLGRGRRAGQGDRVAWVTDHAQHRDHVPDLGQVVEAVATHNHVRDVRLGEPGRDRARDGVGAAEHRDGGRCEAFSDQPRRFRGDGGRLRRSVAASPQLDRWPGLGRAKLLGDAVRVVADQA